MLQIVVNNQDLEFSPRAQKRPREINANNGVKMTVDGVLRLCPVFRDGRTQEGVDDVRTLVERSMRKIPASIWRDINLEPTGCELDSIPFHQNDNEDEFRLPYYRFYPLLRVTSQQMFINNIDNILDAEELTHSRLRPLLQAWWNIPGEPWQAQILMRLRVKFEEKTPDWFEQAYRYAWIERLC